MAITANGGSVTLGGGFSESLPGLPATNLPQAVSYTTQFGSGTGTGNIDLALYVVSAGTLAGGASTTLDFTSYTARDGSTVTTMTKLKFLWIRNTGTVSIDVGGAAATQLIGAGFLKGATDLITLVAGQVICFVVPVGITVSGTVKHLKLLNLSGGTGATYELVAAGSSA